MANEKIKKIVDEISKAVTGKEDIIKKVLTVILAKGHILLEDVPGVGKTTLAIAVSKSVGMDFGRVQFTPDIVPSDITGFTIYDRETGKFEYQKGAVMCNLFLADEINRTSSKTQSALLEVMQEGKVTVDGVSHNVPEPFTVIATQNPVGSAGTQLLPEAQLDRFMMKLSMGYPTFDEQMMILKAREEMNPLENIDSVISVDDVENMIEKSKGVFTDEKIYGYITSLAEATRNDEYIRLGISPRGAIALAAASRAWAYVEGRDYVIPEDVDEIFADVCAHRIVMEPKARLEEIDAKKALALISQRITAPKTDWKIKI